MTEKQIALLRRSVDGMEYNGLSSEEQEIAVELIRTGNCAFPDLSSTTLKATQKGLSLLSDLDKEARQETERKAQQRFENQVSVAGVLVPLITFVLGLIVEYFAQPVAFVFQFFG